VIFRNELRSTSESNNDFLPKVIVVSLAKRCSRQPLLRHSNIGSTVNKSILLTKMMVVTSMTLSLVEPCSLASGQPFEPTFEPSLEKIFVTFQNVVGWQGFHPAKIWSAKMLAPGPVLLINVSSL
jgi:hypothetical protein